MIRALRWVALLLWTPLLWAASIEDSVVKIVNQQSRASWYTPWASSSTGYGTGTGFVIGPNQILTNAHVVSDSALLLVFFHGDPQPYPAQAKVIGHDCDLAIIELKNPARAQALPALPLAKGLPAFRSQVDTYGYPAGGQRISSTAGIVSRIEFNEYVHTGVDQHLTIQTDASINPGNSGGPVIQNGQVIGVAFQGNSQLENTGFFIPLFVVNHFLRDLEDGEYNGYSELGIAEQNMKNPAARNFAKMPDGVTGVRVTKTVKKCSAAPFVKANDIITHINGHPIANDGSIEWQGMRILYPVIAEGLQVGETVTLSVLRNQQPLELKIPLLDYSPTKLQTHQYETQPKFFIYAGWVFVPFNRDSVSTHKDWFTDAPQELIDQLFFRYQTGELAADAPQVMMLRRLDAPVNVDEGFYNYRLIDTINGQSVRTLTEVIKALEENSAPQQVIRFQFSDRINVLDRQTAEETNQAILDNYAIPKDRQL